MTQFGNLRVVVLGIAASGEWAARLLRSRGAIVTVLDEGTAERHAEALERLEAGGATVCFGKGPLPPGPFDLCVASPAFAMEHPWLIECARRVIPIISELELGAVCWSGKILAVTGSKGKSSLVKFLSDTLNLAGISASPAGNYGIPLSQLVMEHPSLQWAVTEVSSFQMEHTPTIHPAVAILLNLQPDHLDRHASFEEYKRLKLRLFANLGPTDFALFPERFDDEGMVPVGVPSYRFGIDPTQADWYYADHAIRTSRGKQLLCSLENSYFDNPILGRAAAAATAALLHLGLEPRQIEAGFAAFQPLPHRMQKIGTDVSKVTWIDDSKATSLSATAAALEMVRPPVRLIAGGLLKEKNLLFLKELLTRTTQKVYLIGDCAGVMAEAWASAVPCEIYGTIDRAVTAAAAESQPNETVLLSPGTASFDQFKSYSERGDLFTQLARAVTGL